MSGRWLNALIAVDETVNALLGGRPRETISGSIGRAVIAGRWWAGAARWLVDGLLGQGHCAYNALVEQARRERGA